MKLKIKWITSGKRKSVESSVTLVVLFYCFYVLRSTKGPHFHKRICLRNCKGMKRKRGSKKGHKKGKRNDPTEVNDPVAALDPIDAVDTICLDQNDESRHDSEMDTEPPDVSTDKPSNISSIEADQPNDNFTGKAGHGRLKVKLKSSRALEPHRSYSDTQTPSDTDKSNQQAALELNNTAVEKEDSTYSDGQTSEMQSNITETVRKKAGSIKIKSSKVSSLSGEDVQNKNRNRQNSPPQMLGERNLVLMGDEITNESLLPKNLQKVEIEQPYKDPRYNGKELNASLAVIKKVMKMDAAEPFNAPVDPVALGIPDYFDIIDTPMDFGTIFRDLERGYKYMNSEDVFKDVQFIWDNCYKYNNKGDYIVDLMKRVKKNFMKYWMAAGLYLDKTSNGAVERTHIEDGIRSSQDKLYSKGKQKHKRRKHGIDLHKSDCLCAVCVVRRRRKERENSGAIQSQMKVNNANLPRELKIEESSPINHNFSEDAASSQDRSQETDARADGDEVEHEENMQSSEQKDMGEPVKQDAMDDEIEPSLYASDSREGSLHPALDNGDREDSNKHSQAQDLDLSFVNETGDQKDVAEIHQQNQDEDGMNGDLTERSQQRTMAQENPLQKENDLVLRICKSLFPSNFKSLWNGPHSLMRRHVPSTRDHGPIHAALAAFMQQ